MADKDFVKAFYGDIKNLNLTLNLGEQYANIKKNYDLALYNFGLRTIILDWANTQSLQIKSPALFQSVVKIDEYNKHNFHEIGSLNAVSLRNAAIARILGKNFHWFLSCDGALPIHDDKINIPLSPEYKSKFDAIKLDKYITIYSDINKFSKEHPKVKTWLLRSWHEYISLLKCQMPQIEVVQCGGGGYEIHFG